MGIPAHKYGKQMTKVKGTLRDMKGKKSVGIVYHDKETGIVRIAKPVGVIGALIPVTNGEATPFGKAIRAIKTRNGIIVAPHPRAKMATCEAAEPMQPATTQPRKLPSRSAVPAMPTTIMPSSTL